MKCHAGGNARATAAVDMRAALTCPQKLACIAGRERQRCLKGAPIPRPQRSRGNLAENHAAIRPRELQLMTTGIPLTWLLVGPLARRTTANRAPPQGVNLWTIQQSLNPSIGDSENDANLTDLQTEPNTRHRTPLPSAVQTAFARKRPALPRQCTQQLQAAQTDADEPRRPTKTLDGYRHASGFRRPADAVKSATDAL